MTATSDLKNGSLKLSNELPRQQSKSNLSVDRNSNVIKHDQKPQSKAVMTRTNHNNCLQNNHNNLTCGNNLSSYSNLDSDSFAKLSTDKKKHNNSDLRDHLDLSDFDELSFHPTKNPQDTSSLSLPRNLMSRLNQISSPVTRKLKFWNKKSFQVNQYDPSFKVIYLGNLGIQLWSKDETCLEKPLNTLWHNYLVNMKTEIVMRLTVCNSGLKAITRQHGLTQYWSHRLVYCCAHTNYPKVFSWVYRHEGKKMRQELRCHAVFCSSAEKATKMVYLLNQRLANALQEFKREKKSRASSLVINGSTSSELLQRLPRTIPLRRQILAKGSANFRPPLERSKSAPKLTSILEEECESDEDDSSHEEFECEHLFGDGDDDDEDDDSNRAEGSDCDNREDECSTQQTDSLATTSNEDTSNSSVFASSNITTNDSKLFMTDEEPERLLLGLTFDSDRASTEHYNLVKNSSGTNSLSASDKSSSANEEACVEIECHKKPGEEEKQSSAIANLCSPSSLIRTKSTLLKDRSTQAIHNRWGARNTSNKPQKVYNDQGSDSSTCEMLSSWSNRVIT